MTEMVQVNVKPLSVNQCWQGRRYKTSDYETYEWQVIRELPPITLPDPPYELKIIFGLSNMAQDVDNGIKPFLDILQKKYRFDDKHVHRLIIDKVKTTKGGEFTKFQMISMKT